MQLCDCADIIVVVLKKKAQLVLYFYIYFLYLEIFHVLKNFCKVAFDRLPCLHVSSLTGSNCKRHRLTRLVYLTIFPKNLPQTPTTRLDLICAFNLEISSKVAPITKSRLSFSENQLSLTHNVRLNGDIYENCL